MTVAQKFRRNRKITITTSATVSIRVNRTSLTEARMVWVRSDRIETLMSFGIDGLQLRQHRLDAVDRGDDVGAGLTLDREQ